MSDYYEKLAQALNALPQGFPRTESNVEAEILQLMFTPQEARMAAFMSDSWDTVAVAAQKVGLPSLEAARLMQTMAQKGLLLYWNDHGEDRFCLNHFVVGSYEVTMHRLDGEDAHQFAHLVEHYMEQTRGLAGIMQPDPNIHRVVPVTGATKQEWILPYDDVKAFLEGANSFHLIDCICRKQHNLVSEEQCAFPMPTCLNFSISERPESPSTITRAEALAFLDSVEEIGLVHTVSNVGKGISYVCNCCGCCCGILRGITDFGLTDSVAQANYHVAIAEDRCTGCGRCVKRCQVTAVRLSAGLAVVDAEQCVGCGLCVTACPTKAATLQLKPEDKIVPPPMDMGEWVTRRKRSRGLS